MAGPAAARAAAGPDAGGGSMIELTRLNGATIFLNIDLLQAVEAMPDTILTLFGGEKLVVREAVEVVVRRFNARRRLLGRRPPRIVREPGPEETA